VKLLHKKGAEAWYVMKMILMFILIMALCGLAFFLYMKARHSSLFGG
jgi:hypothetical protein